MKSLLLVLALSSPLSALATEGFWNRIDCEYALVDGQWSRQGAHYSSNAFPVPKYEPIYALQTWSTSKNARGEVFAICGSLAATAQPDTVFVELYTWSASSILDLHGCEPVGENVKLLRKEARTLPRGTTLRASVPWSGKYEQAMLVTHFPTVAEMADIEATVEKVCPYDELP